ncbi:hypothetical protein M885DRAFT_533213 [Pelagophyceae sp. CCMP2097]|nr:hypothetical protein M885DRAFT_533213 [Pelagophyceae sp. CCMP2097]
MVHLSDEHEYRLPSVLKRLQRARYPPPPRTAVAAMFLFWLGSILLIIAAAEGWFENPVPKGQRFAVFITGCVTFVPGSYATWRLWGAFRRWPGYKYDQVPSWDD